MSRKKIDKWLHEAVTAHQQGDMAKASSLYGQVLKIDPKCADALYLSGVIAYQSQRLDEALGLITRAIKQYNHEPMYWNSLGLVKRALGDSVAALDSYRRAVQLKPAYAEAWLNMGVAWNQLGNGEEEQRCYEKALELNPRYITAIKNLAQYFSVKKRYTESMSLYEKALELAPNDYESLSGLVIAKISICDWRNLAELYGLIDQRIYSKAEAFITPWIYLSMSASPEAQLLCAQAWSERVMTPIERISRARLKSPVTNKKPIRIAYWSADFRDHAVSQQLIEVIELHDRSEFEVTLLSYGPDDGSEMRRRLVGAADKFIDIVNSSYDEVVSYISEHEIDIVVDLVGYTSQTRSPMLAMRPAPVQIQWLGYAGSMGTSHVDYLIADEFVVPEEMEKFYSEKIIKLPNSYQPVDRKRQCAEVRSRTEYGLPEKGVVFCSFSRSSKIQPEMFDSWMRIMGRTTDSVLWIPSAGQEMEENLRKEAQCRGIDKDRLIFAPIIPLLQHRARYHVADIFLDTYPYGSHATATDSLWEGCPVVTLAGQTFASRVSGSQLRAVNMPELITNNYTDYENVAVSLALDPTRLGTLRERLLAGRNTLPLFDTVAFTKHLEDAYRRVIEAQVTNVKE